MTTGDLLRQGASRVREKWTQGEWEHDGGYCAVGSLFANRPVTLADMDQEILAARFIVRALGGDWLDSATQVLARIYNWNDAMLQNSETVAHTMEFAAILADQEDAARAERDARALVTA